MRERVDAYAGKIEQYASAAYNYDYNREYPLMVAETPVPYGNKKVTFGGKAWMREKATSMRS